MEILLFPQEIDCFAIWQLKNLTLHVDVFISLFYLKFVGLFVFIESCSGCGERCAAIPGIIVGGLKT